MGQQSAATVKAASANWNKLKQSLPAKPVATQIYLKKRKRKEMQTDARHNLDHALGEDLAEASTSNSVNEAGKFVALDCEFVGVGPNGSRSSLARVSIVNYYGHVLLDTFVRQKEKVTDYRTFVSGVRPNDLKGAPTFEEVTKQVAELCQGRILVGHAIHNDLQVLMLSHPRSQLRDTAFYKPLQVIARTNRPSLRNLAKLVLNLDVQVGEHSSVEDAKATMAIFKAHREAWDLSIAKPQKPLPSKAKAAPPSAGSIDPTRRFRHRQTMGLAKAAAEAGLVSSANEEALDKEASDQEAGQDGKATIASQQRVNAKRKKMESTVTHAIIPQQNSSKKLENEWWLE